MSDEPTQSSTITASSVGVAGTANPPPSLLHPWEWPEQPWFRIHIDYAGPVMGRMLLIITDAHLK